MVNFDGIYSVRFRSGTRHGAGIAVFSDGHIYGGDRVCFYKGFLTADGENVSGTLIIKKYQTGESVLLLDEFTLSVEGSISNNGFNSIYLTGQLSEQPDRRVIITGEKRAELD